MKSYEMWAWLVEEPDGTSGVVAAMFPPFPAPVPLQARTEELAMKFEPYALAHAEASGNPVRLAHLREQ